MAVTHAGFVVQAFRELFAIEGTPARIDPGFMSIVEWEYAGVWRLVRYEEQDQANRI